MTSRRRLRDALLALFAAALCLLLPRLSLPAEPRVALFVGVDVSGSFQQGPHFSGAIGFLAHYLYARLRGLGGLEKPAVLFVAPIGGAAGDEPQTFYPIQTFADHSVAELGGKLLELFPPDRRSPYTDYNAFFGRIAETVKARRLVLRPLTVIMLTDGRLDAPGLPGGPHDYRGVDLAPLERVSRNVTLRLLYTPPAVGVEWERVVPRRRVKMWIQDPAVMASWNNPHLLVPGIPLERQEKFFAWIRDHVDFGVRVRTAK